MAASREWIAAGASSTVGRPLIGYADYRAGDTSADVRFKGVQLSGDYTFSVTISNTELPYFYELSYASVGPLPMHVWAPGVTIDSNADGAKVGAGGFANLTNIVAPGGYRFAPRVTAGPYNFVSFVNQVVRLEKNPTFKGDYRGHLPSIDTIIIRNVNQLLDVDLVISGEIDMTTGVIEGAKIQAAQADANTNLSFYSRNGYGLLAMTADFGPTQDYRVRQAVAFITDRQFVTDAVLEGYGSITFSEYGLAQWMYVESQDWVEDNLNPYNFSITQANNILDTTDWRFESDGTTPFDRTKATLNSEYYRYNAAGEQFRLRHFGTENNPITDSLQARFELNMQLIGARYDVTIGDFAALLDNYYAKAYGTPDSERQFHIFNLASNFAAAYDPFFSWHSEFVGTFNNPHGLADTPTSPAAPLAPGERTLDELTVAMRLTEPGDRVSYIALWREYQLRWNKLMPNVPLYSNQYYDVYNNRVKGVATTPFWNWSIAVIDMYIEG
jgi:peptide/nickel transport system substrate-binding protein